MNLKKIYFSHEGRMPRGEFFGYILLVSLACGVLNYLIDDTFNPLITTIVATLVNLAGLFLFYPALIFKREHDRGFDGKKKVTWILSLFAIGHILNLGINITMLNALGDFETKINSVVQQLETASSTGDQMKFFNDYQNLEKETASKIMETMKKPEVITLYSATIIAGLRCIILYRPLLFRRGEKGHNKYGPDPLEKDK